MRSRTKGSTGGGRLRQKRRNARPFCRIQCILELRRHVFHDT